MRQDTQCIGCGRREVKVAQILGLCADCIRKDFDRWQERILSIHKRVREDDGLPALPPRSQDGKRCHFCGNQCVLGEGDVGYCGLRFGEGGSIKSKVGSDRGKVSWYLDALPTNCVADWVCAGGSEAGYPAYSHCKGPEYGYYNLAVFYEACSFNCLFCQNWHFRYQRGGDHSPDEVARSINQRVSCVCFFGGDPGPQIVHALSVAEIARKKNRIMRICWETNGNISPRYLDAMVDVSIKSGGTIKVDLKAWSEPLNIALCGISNKRTIEVVKQLLLLSKKRKDPPLLVISTLLVPGYVDAEEVGAIASFIAGIDRDVPYALLAFAPNYMMSDLATTSFYHAEKCFEAATSAGLRSVRIGNRHLLSKESQC